MGPDYIRDLFSSFRPVDVRRLFSGAGIFAEGVMFGLVVDQMIYLKVGEDNAADFEREELPAFQYRAKGGRRAVMSYRRMPERLYDDPDELAQWAAKALQVATLKARPKGRAKAVKKETKRR